MAGRVSHLGGGSSLLDMKLSSVLSFGGGGRKAYVPLAMTFSSLTGVQKHDHGS
jgi:hypothetical protein